MPRVEKIRKIKKIDQIADAHLIVFCRYFRGGLCERTSLQQERVCEYNLHIIMSQISKSFGGEGAPDKQKRVRRTRKDGDERSFVCQKCFKTYLSNAALYTHDKNKHSHQKPRDEQPQDPPEEPQVESEEQQAEEKEDEIFSAPPSVPIPSSRESKQFKEQYFEANPAALQGLRNYMKKFYPERNKGCSIKLICQGLSAEVLQYIEPVLRETLEIKYSELNRSQMTLNQIFGIFLMLMNIRVSSSCISFLLRYFYYLRTAINQEAKDDNYCETCNAEKVPTFFNNIILSKKIPLPGVDEEELMYNPIVVCTILEYFGYWLYDQQYTDYKITPNYDHNA